MPQRDSHDHALLLLSKARADKLVLDKLADDSEITDDVIGFHAQQAVEKLLEAVLANRNVEYPRVPRRRPPRRSARGSRRLAATPGATAGRTRGVTPIGLARLARTASVLTTPPYPR